MLIPISQVLCYLERQSLVLLSPILTTLAMLGSFATGAYLALDFQATILCSA